MAAVTFPDPAATNPATGAPYGDGWYNAANGVTYTFENNVWSAITEPNTSLDDRYVEVEGDNMTGDLTLGPDGGPATITLDESEGDITVTGDVQMASQNGGPLAGFRNQIINGAMEIGQRALTDVVDWTADRWRGLNVPVRYYVIPDGQFYRSIGPLADVANIVQPIELPPVAGERGVFQAGSTWTLSLYAAAAAPAASVYFSTASFNGTILLETQFTLTQTGETEGGLNRWSGTITMPDGDIGSSTCLVLSTAFQNGERFTGVQLEPGPVATPFEHRPIGTELALCQRYYQRIGEIGIKLSNVGGGLPMLVATSLLTQMRAAPSFTYDSTNGTFNTAYPSPTHVTIDGTADANGHLSLGDCQCDAEL